MKSAVVTGAGGFIGHALSKKLLEGGCRVYGVDVAGQSMKDLENYENFRPICTNLADGSLRQNIDGVVDVLYYLSWGGKLGGRDLYDADLQTSNIATAARVCTDMGGLCRRFIFAGSSYEFMKNKSKDIPFCIYGVAKRAAADMCASIALRSRMEFNKAILTNTYGVGDRSEKAVNTIAWAMMNGLPLKLVEGDRPNDWVYVDDTVEGLIHAACGISFKEYYIGHSEITTFREKITMMRDVLCPDRELKFGEMPEDTYIDYSETDLNALGDDTGFMCREEFNSSIIKTAEWLRQSRKCSEVRPESDRGGYKSERIINMPVPMLPLAGRRAA